MNFFPLILVILLPALMLPLMRLFIKYAPKAGYYSRRTPGSAHKGMRPVGAGIVMAISTSVAGFILVLVGNTELLLPIAFAFSICLVGLMDDRYSLSIPTRILAQLLACGFCLWGITVLFPPDHWSWLLSNPQVYMAFMATLVLGGAFWINLFNFMDGIDGLAASHAAFALTAMVLLADPGHFPPSAAGIYFALVALSAVLFLLFNWAPSRVFMGDAGSYFLGFVIFYAAIWGEFSGHIPLIESVIINSIFLADSLVTLVTRAITGQKFWFGHRLHAYHKLSKKFGHAPIVLSVLGLNIFWVAPITAAVHFDMLTPFVGIGLTLLPAVSSAIMLRAGLQSDQPKA